MDDDRLLLSLRRIAEPADPASAFLDDLYETLAAELGFRSDASTDSIHVTRVPATRWARRARRLAWLVAAALLALAILAGVVLVGALLERRQPPSPPPFSDVTSYRSDAQRTGVQPGPGPSGHPVVIWSAKADGPIQFNPVLASGVLFVGSDDGRLYALDGRSGSVRWSFDAGVAIKGSAVAQGGVVAVADANGVLHAIDQATGMERWRADGISDVGNVSAGVLYAPGRDNAVHGFDLQSGAPRWTWQAPEPVLYVTVVADTAYVTAGGTLHAVVIADGSERWSFDTQGVQASLASVAGDQVFVSTRAGAGALTALDLASGSRLWTFPGPSGAIISVGSIQDGTIYAPTSGQGFFALTARTGDVVWHAPNIGSILRSTPIVDGVVFAPVDDPGGILAIRASDGSVAWQHQLGGMMQGWPVVSGGLVFTTDGSGEIQAFGDAPPAGTIGSVAPRPVASPPNVPASEPSVPPNPSTVSSTLLPATTGVVGAADIDVGPDGNLYVVDYRPMVSVISPDGRLLRRLGPRRHRRRRVRFLGAKPGRGRPDCRRPRRPRLRVGRRQWSRPGLYARPASTSGSSATAAPRATVLRSPGISASTIRAVLMSSTVGGRLSPSSGRTAR